MSDDDGIPDFVRLIEVSSANGQALSGDWRRKEAVRDFWDAASCGEIYAEGEDVCARLHAQAHARYLLEPYILTFARFGEGEGRDVLEIGVGMGADHARWASSKPRSLHGIDLTPRAVEYTRMRFACEGLSSQLRVADAEALPFADGSFDLVYSWGVLHHSPDTERCFREVHRVLRPGGIARMMIYHRWSLVGYMLWLRYALLRGRPFRSLDEIYATHLESPGTKAYSVDQARAMLAYFSRVSITPQLSFGDLLQGGVGQRHGGVLLRVAKSLWPRWLLRRLFARHGLFLLIEAWK